MLPPLVLLFGLIWEYPSFLSCGIFPLFYLESRVAAVSGQSEGQEVWGVAVALKPGYLKKERKREKVFSETLLNVAGFP